MSFLTVTVNNELIGQEPVIRGFNTTTQQIQLPYISLFIFQEVRLVTDMLQLLHIYNQ